MKPLIRVIGQRGMIMIALLLMALLTGCQRQEILVTTGELEQMPAFVAQVERTYARETDKGRVFGIWLIRGDGKRICVGNIPVSSDLEAFGRRLKPGQSYEFPKAWLDFKAGTEIAPQA